MRHRLMTAIAVRDNGCGYMTLHGQPPDFFWLLLFLLLLLLPFFGESVSMAWYPAFGSFEVLPLALDDEVEVAGAACCGGFFSAFRLRSASASSLALR